MSKISEHIHPSFYRITVICFGGYFLVGRSVVMIFTNVHIVAYVGLRSN